MGSLVVMALAASAILYSFRENMLFFYTPTQLVAKHTAPDFDRSRPLRIGGLVKAGSIKNKRDRGIIFTITDLHAEVKVIYRGLVPSLFREHQGVVAQGVLDAKGVLIAETILAKHDEKYMPREVVDALKASGKWQEDGGYRKSPQP